MCRRAGLEINLNKRTVDDKWDTTKWFLRDSHLDHQHTVKGSRQSLSICSFLSDIIGGWWLVDLLISDGGGEGREWKWKLVEKCFIMFGATHQWCAEVVPTPDVLLIYYHGARIAHFSGDKKKKLVTAVMPNHHLHLHNYHILVTVALSIMSFCLASRSNFTRSCDWELSQTSTRVSFFLGSNPN